MDHAATVWQQATHLTVLMAEAQTVIALRTMGMAGLWPMPQGETARMVNEKPPAFVESWVAAGFAMLTMQSPGAVLQAWTRPLTRKARSNRRRLSRAKR
ncbi:MAG: antifreeze protein [Roseivivax sp.]|nr:antifreeze protein [Roseivivax sp.]